MLLLVAALPLGAQSARTAWRSPKITLRLGVTNTPDAFSSSCGDVARAIGIDVRSASRVFPFASLDHFARVGGGDKRCGVSTSGNQLSAGGLSLDGTTAAMAGVGWRSAPASVQLEAVLGAGVFRGPQGFGDRSTSVSRPAIGASVGAVFFNHVVLSVDRHWLRLAFDNGSGAGESADWQSMGPWRLGVRF